MKLTKTHLLLIAIFILAFVLRLITAHYFPIGSDEIIYSLIPLNIIEAHRLSTVEQAPVFFYLTDIGYTLTGGFSITRARLPSIFFGASAVFIVFLLAQELFQNRKASIIASFLFAVSGFSLYNNQEMDMTAFFFALFSLYFFIKVLNAKYKNMYFASFFLALAALSKPIILLFAIPYAILFILHIQNQPAEHNTKEKLRSIIKIISVSILIALLTVMPVLTYNYLLHKEKGITDYYFSAIAGIGTNKIYAGQEGHSWSLSRLFGTSKIIFTSILRFDFIILVFGIVGLFIAWKKQKHTTLLCILTIIFFVGYLAGRTGSSTHYVWIPLILSIFAGYAIITFSTYTAEHFKFKYLAIIFIAITLISSLLLVKNVIPQRQTSISIALQEYSTQNIPQDAIVVLDPRIYRGVFAWSFYDKHYLEGTQFPEVMNFIQKTSEPKQSMPLYYVECGPGTYCGWKPEDFNRISSYGQQLSASLTPQMQKVQELHAIDTFIIYKGAIDASPSIYEPIDRTHMHWYTPVGWKYTENAIDNYTPSTLFDKTLNAFAFLILYLDVLAALLTPFFVFYLVTKQQPVMEHTSTEHKEKT